MKDSIGQALIFSETEFAVIVCASKEKTFVGYGISESSLSMESRFKGVNALLRRGVLEKKQEDYCLKEDIAPMLRSIISARRCFTISQDFGVIYCDEEYVLVQRFESLPPRFIVQSVTPESLAQMLSDRQMLPENDEYEFMAESLPSQDEMFGMLEQDENSMLQISQFDTQRSLSVMRVGLCEAVVSRCGEKLTCDTYSRNNFEKELRSLLEGEEI